MLEDNGNRFLEKKNWSEHKVQSKNVFLKKKLPTRPEYTLKI